MRIKIANARNFLGAHMRHILIVRMQIVIVFFWIVVPGRLVSHAQSGPNQTKKVQATAGPVHKTKNLVIFLMDGYRWKELFGGADSALLFNSRFNKQDSAGVVANYWASSLQQRREKLMPFVWSTIARNGQLYGNRALG